VTKLKRKPPASVLKKLIRGYLTGRPKAAETLQRTLDRIRAFDGEMPSTRGSKTSLLFTDIAGSTALFEQYGDLYGHQIVAIHDRIVRPIIAKRGGTQIKHTGDGILASFASCGRSVKAAILIQRQIECHNQRFPLLQLQVRIGTNIGAVIRSSGDLYGTSVNLAARLCEAVEAAGILTTGIVRKRCISKGYTFRDRGSMMFKGFTKRIPIFEIVWRTQAS
jgi:class 3 adenylate cyclase